MRARRSLALGLSAALAASGISMIAAGGSAQAVSGTVNLYSQINPSFQSTPVPQGAKNIALTVTPSSGVPGTEIEVRVSSSDLSFANGPAADIASGTLSLDAVINVNGSDYTLRGSAVGQNIPTNTAVDTSGNPTPPPDGSAGTNTAPDNPTNFNSGWVISSTPGNSSSTSTVKGEGAWTSTLSGTSGTVAGSGGIGSVVRGSEAAAVHVPLTIPNDAEKNSTVAVTLKAIVANSGTAAVNDGFDQVINVSSTAAKNGLNNNVAASYISQAAPTGVGTADFLVTAPVDIVIDSVTDNGTAIPATPAAVRAGNVITFSSGDNDGWRPDNRVRVTACSDVAGTSCAPSFVEPTLWAGSATAYGATYPMANADGELAPSPLYLAAVSSFGGSDAAFVAYQGASVAAATHKDGVAARFLKNDRTLSVPAVVVDEEFEITGADFYPGETVTISDDGTDNTPVTAVADANGAITADYTVEDSDATAITASGIGTPVTVKIVPDITITSIKNGTATVPGARTGDLVSVTGNDRWTADLGAASGTQGGIVLRVCNVDGTTGCAPLNATIAGNQVITVGSLGTDEDGQLNDFTYTAATGGYSGDKALVVAEVDGPLATTFGGPGSTPPNIVKQAIAPLTLVADRDVVAPASIDAGAATTITGSGFYAGETVTISAGNSATATTVASTTGTISTSYTVTDLTATKVTASGIGGSADSDAVTVKDVTAPTGSASVSPNSGIVGLTSTVTLNVNDNAGKPGISGVVTWGDGATSTIAAGATKASHKFTKTGTFAVSVKVRDAAGNQTTLNAGTVKVAPVPVVKDTTAPVVKIKAIKGKASKVKAVSGTITDKGGVKSVTIKVIQKRGSKWYAFNGKKWVKVKNEKAALKKAKAITDTSVANGWSIKVKGVKKGTVTVSYFGTDKAGNKSKAKTYTSKKLK